MVSEFPCPCSGNTHTHPFSFFGQYIFILYRDYVERYVQERHVWYVNRVKCFIFLQFHDQTLKCVCKGKQIMCLTTPIKKWSNNAIIGTEQITIATLGYIHIDPGPLTIFLARWHEETSSFHLSIVEMIVRLIDVSCLLHYLSNAI